MRPIDHFDAAAECFRTRTALFDADGAPVSFADLRAMSERVASALAIIPADHGVLRVALYSPNDYRWIVAALGIMRAGGVVVPVHAPGGLERNVAFLTQADPHVAIYHSAVRDSAEAMQAALNPNIHWICLDRDEPGHPSLETFTSNAPPYRDDWGDAYGNPGRPSFIRQTSGTAGLPKVVLADIASFDATHRVHLEKLRCHDVEPVCLVTAPLSHAAFVHAFAMLTLGARLVILPEFDADDVLATIERHRVTHTWMTSTALNLLLEHMETERVRSVSLKSLVLGAAAVAPARLRQAVSLLGPCVSLNYSQIEGGFVTWLDAGTIAAAAAGTAPQRLESCGTSVFSCRIGIMDEDGRQLHAGETGEIVVRGPAVKPYILSPGVPDDREMTASRRFGWHHTGDIGRFDDDGYLYVVGRKKDIVVTAGFKISSAEVERIVLELPQLSECAVVGVPDEVRGEAVKAVVTVKPGCAVAPGDVVSHCAARLGRQLAHMSVEHWPSLPKNSVGKVDKPAIRERVLRHASVVPA